MTGQGGPSFTQGGMAPGGSEMENWKAQPASAAEAEAATGDPVQPQDEGLLDRLKDQ